ncbi:hypothetical protein QBC38DRAFT_357767 [Podospora fimiseda]|uniref:JmjC domain-containing protein n=1 Tax=Podospora fimiseda TaxID=252190 RepID=A0AAN7BV32_9PEZI|nr:hypothetical protein QBC38DRAFT_357767 [Podospora fimiseda]
MSRVFLHPSLRIISKKSSTHKFRWLSTVHEINELLPEKKDIDTSKPFIIRNHAQTPSQTSTTISISKWFTNHEKFPKFTDYLNQHLHFTLPYELILPTTQEYDTNPINPIKRFISWLSSTQQQPNHYTLVSVLLQQEINNLNKTNNNNHLRFLRFDAPFALLSAALEYNSLFPDLPLTELYIAQAPLSNLPAALQADLSTPKSLLSYLGKGDIYGSSIWIGLEPTYTPWHRDPNPNLFCQLRRTKVMRLMPPNRGRSLFERVQAGLQGTTSWRIRGEEMMQGEERQALFKAVWEEESKKGIMTEVVLSEGDVLYLPKGWWHSVRTLGSGCLNMSVNWWFR